MRNDHFRAVAMVAAQMALLGVTGWIIGGWWLGGVAAGGVFFLYRYTPDASFGMIQRIFGGRRIDYEQAPRLYDLLRPLTAKAGLSHLPYFYYLPRKGMIAFTLVSNGRGAIALSEGMLDNLSPRELTGVLAHEVAHIRNRDTRLMSFAALVRQLTGTLAFFGQMLLLINLPFIVSGQLVVSWITILVLIGAPLISVLLQMALSRGQEYRADTDAAALTGDPAGLGSALARIERLQQSGWTRWLQSGRNEWLHTHPNTEERVRRLALMAEKQRSDEDDHRESDHWHGQQGGETGAGGGSRVFCRDC